MIGHQQRAGNSVGQICLDLDAERIKECCRPAGFQGQSLALTAQRENA